MRFLQGRSICLLYVMVAVIFAGTAFGATPELPKGLVISDTFKPGYGAAVGKVHMVQGKVVIMHADEKEGYWAKKNQPLYKGDIIVTQKKSRTNFMMNDKSVITLSSDTKIVINKSIYDEKKKTRSSFLGLSLGKARFIVSKLFSFKRKEFKVKTVTAVCGVRGSDFIIEAGPDTTQVTALEDTVLSVMSLATPDEAPVVISDFQRTGVAMGESPYKPVFVPSEEIETLMQDVSGAPEGAATGEEVEQEGTTDEEDSSSEGEDAETEESSAESDADTEEAQEDESAESDTAAEESQDEESAEDDATTEESQEGESTEGDSTTGETQEGESSERDADSEESQTGEAEESDTASGEAQSEEPAASETSSGDTSASEPVESDAASGETQTGEPVESESSGAAPIEDDGATESNVGAVETDSAADPEAVYVPVEALVEPDLPTEFETGIEIHEIILNVVEEPDVADQVAEQILQEDLAIPELPGPPE